MNDLETLRPEVQAAMRTMDGQAGGNRDDAYDVIEAELLRLAGENAELREQTKMPAVAWQQRTEQAEAELAALKNFVREGNAVWEYLQKVSPWSESNDMLWSDEIICGIDGLVHERDEARTELATLKARMKPCARVVGGEVRVFMDSGDEGKYVAVLVVEECVMEALRA